MNSTGVQELETTVSAVLEATPWIEIHMHLFAPAFGQIGLWGIDELLTSLAPLFRTNFVRFLEIS